MIKNEIDAAIETLLDAGYYVIPKDQVRTLGVSAALSKLLLEQSNIDTQHLMQITKDNMMSRMVGELEKAGAFMVNHREDKAHYTHVIDAKLCVILPIERPTIDARAD